MKKIILTTIVFALTITQVNGQYSLISDINSGASGSLPDDLFVFNNKVFFTVEDDGVNGMEIYSYDGINAPSLFFDLNTSGGSTYSGFREINSKLYFSGYEVTYGNEMYEYDGINTPTRISDICPGGCNSLPHDFTYFNNKIYFGANGPGNDHELYAYDGVNPPTLVYDINPTGNAYPYELTVLNNKLYFRASDGVNGSELWQYDGVSNPTQVIDINSVTGDSWPSYLKVINNILYFSASDGTTGTELWKCDGTNAPTMVVDLEFGAGSSNPKYFFEFAGKLWFNATLTGFGSELTSYDGSLTEVYEINAGTNGSDPRYFTLYDNEIYFRATETTMGREIWKTNGTANSFVADIYSGSGSSSSDWNLSTRKSFAVLNDILIFGADNGIIGEELYQFVSSASISTLSELEKMILYPNPTSSNLTIETEEAIQSVSIFNITGALVQQEKTNSFSVEALPAGIYIVNIATENQVQTMRFVKE